ncbi:MAG: Holliday junction branch migration protein RuvA [Pseudomonadota bacterium]
MIAWLSGALLEADNDTLVLNVGGVGYEIAVTAGVQAVLPRPGEALTLHVHQVVREDALTLFGFRDRTERDVFRSLIRANGVGPKLALAILSALTIDELAGAVQAQDVTPLTRVSGVGKKTAERLLVELKGRFADVIVAAPVDVAKVPVEADEALSALQALGYRPAEAARMLEQSGAAAAVTVEEQVRLALRSQVR